MAQVVLNYRESKNANNMLNMLLASGMFTLENPQKTKIRTEFFKAMDESRSIAKKVKEQGSTKGLKTLDELLAELN
ncbi:MAG: hypothetical protein MJ198_07880 [Bacteroidales bacterium]|nr:hypothetical protein [Bacteroidales bacterium]